MNTKKPYLQIAALALSLTLTLNTAPPAFADGGDSATVGTVSISNQSYFALKSIHLTTSENGKLAVLNLSIHNGGKNALKIIDYWVRLKNKLNSEFVARSLPADKEKSHIAPGSNVDLTYYASVNENTQLQDLIIEFIKWDLNQVNFERLLGEVVIPETYSDVTPFTESAILRIGEMDVKASIKKLVSNKNEKFHLPTVYLTLENVGTHPVTIPAYLFAIRTEELLLYPLGSKGLKDLEIKPKATKELQLTGTIPVAVSTEHWELVVTENVPDLKINFHVAANQLPTASLNQGGSVGENQLETNVDGHKLVLVFEDGGEEKSFEKLFEMKEFDPVDGETSEKFQV
ncbi:hypothetical protein GK047_11545 [Paenibacillus sp. SYP-B3998]|uniref:DUF4352 domain-containing protein n=1 Tax=Paenibacillus sp. SYP-B3998 TaxID=2678564 RepID=A0A6G3ZX76_9BACL|nr:hypothetical protein [Paenibacillus sp. SYP-B3998]NEW06648.1 hypothetical protein [Paenibacillus sp. SYP-B3998]